MVGNAVVVNFSGGETSPRSRGRFDLPWYQTSVEKLTNYIAEITGSARFRPGLRHSRITRGGATPRMIAFQINNSLAYELEFTPGYMRVYLASTTRDLLTTTKASVTNVTQANPAVMTVASAAGFANGDELILTDIGGMPELHNRQVKIAGLSGNSFNLTDSVTGANIDTSTLSAYTSGGSADKIYEITTPYGASELPNLQWAPEGTTGTMYIVSGTRSPRKLTVSGTTFAISTFTRTNDPFSGTSMPASALVDDFETGDLSKWSASGTAGVKNTSWVGNTAAPSVPLAHNYAFASQPNAIVGDFIGYIQAAQTKAYGSWQVDVGSAMSTLCNGAVLDTNYFEWRFLMVDTINYYHFKIFGPNANSISLVKYVAGVPTVLGTATITALRSVAAGRTFRISRTSDGEFTVYDSGAAVLVVTDTTHTTSTIMQMRVGTSGNTVETAPTTNSVAWYNIGSTDWQLLCWADNVYVTDTEVTENPLSVAFYEGRLVYGGTTRRPACIFASRAPDSSGNSRYDDFTGGSNADHACFFQFAPVSGSSDYIAWIRGGPDYLFSGTFGGPFRISGSGLDIPITPSSINVRQFDTAGAEATMAAGLAQMFFIQRGGTSLRSIKVINPYLATFESSDLCLNAEQIPAESPLQRVALANGRPPILWAYREDGVLCGLTVHVTVQNADVLAGWHRHKLGGASAKVVDISVVERAGGLDQLWLAVRRTVNGTSRCTVEYMADDVVFPDPEDFYTGSQAADLLAWENAVYRAQESYIHVDGAATYNGSDRGVTAAATLTPGATGAEGDTIALTASADVFVAGDVGLEVWHKPALATGVGAGRAVITAVSDAQHATATILTPFSSTDAIAAGDWYFATTHIYGLPHLEGSVVAVVTDGAVASDGGQSGAGKYPVYTVANGGITLANAAAVVHVGFPYLGFLKTHNLVMGGQTGPAEAKPRNISEINIRFMNTLGANYGTNPYALDAVEHRLSDAIADRPPPVFSGIRRVKLKDGWSGLDDATREKNVFISQPLPVPCVVQGLDVSYDTTDDGGYA